MVIQTEAFAVTDIRSLFTAVEHMAQADGCAAAGKGISRMHQDLAAVIIIHIACTGPADIMLVIGPEILQALAAYVLDHDLGTCGRIIIQIVIR